MESQQQFRIEARILVKAYPQSSQRYQETVCVAAIVPKTGRLIRLYPIRYRMLPEQHRFSRWDLIRATVVQDRTDGRPESHRVLEGTLEVVERGLPKSQRVKLWAPHVYNTRAELDEARKRDGTSLGIVRPDPGSFRFKVKNVDHAEGDELLLAQSVVSQAQLYEEQLPPLPEPTHIFELQYTSGGIKYTNKLIDWEVQQADAKFARKYGAEDGLRHLKEKYQVEIPSRGLHLILGTVKQHPHRFTAIGTLRSGAPKAPEDQAAFVF